MSHDPEIALLLDMLDRAFDRKSWHGTNLRGSIRGLSADQAAWRPAPGRHNAWEIVVHAAYWKYVVRRRFRPEARGSFPLRGSNWFVRPTAGLDADALWREDLTLLADQHRRLREAVASLTSAELHAPPPSPSTTSNLALVEGAAAHDLYHAGQIQLLKRLCGAGT